MCVCASALFAPAACGTNSNSYNYDGSCHSAQISYQYEKPSYRVLFFAIFALLLFQLLCQPGYQVSQVPAWQSQLLTHTYTIYVCMWVCKYIECLLNFSYPRQLSVLPSFYFTFQTLPEVICVCFARFLANVWVY